KKFNPFNVSSDVTKAIQDRFLKKAGLTDDVGKQLVKDIKKGAIKNLDDITDPGARKFIKNNLFEFVQYFGSSFSKEFVDNCLKLSMGDEIFELIKNGITANDLYFDLIEKIGKKAADNILSDSNTLILMQLRYGSKNVNKLMNARVLYNQLMKTNTYLSEEKLRSVVTGLMDGSIKSLDDVVKINKQISENMCRSYEAVAMAINNLGNEKELSGLLNDIACNRLEYLKLSPDFAKDLIQNSLSKVDIINKYGDDVYKKLVSSYNRSVNCLLIQAKLNHSLIEEMTTDFLKGEGLADDIVAKIMSGTSIAEWGIPDNKVMRICNVVSDYYRVSDESMYRNYVLEIAELRGDYISDFVAQYKQAGNTIINLKYAGCIMQPTGANSAYIKAKYGNIYMSKQGFAILDDYAIARVQLPGLTGLNDGADDIARANLIHHGIKESIPGYTWHHLEDGKTMILVPTELHEAYRHTGGADLLRKGLKEAIENGVY
ncbi:MAG: HNH endonuclease, partial [Solobacterium sp.]|nr:HNH endonuclease [Solobacterium sp.]